MDRSRKGVAATVIRARLGRYLFAVDEADLLDANIGGEVRVDIENGTVVRVYR